jgi:hypothetical protein
LDGAVWTFASFLSAYEAGDTRAIEKIVSPVLFKIMKEHDMIPPPQAISPTANATSTFTAPSDYLSAHLKNVIPTVGRGGMLVPYKKDDEVFTAIMRRVRDGRLLTPPYRLFLGVTFQYTFRQLDGEMLTTHSDPWVFEQRLPDLDWHVSIVDNFPPQRHRASLWAALRPDHAVLENNQG